MIEDEVTLIQKDNEILTSSLMWLTNLERVMPKY